MSHSPLVSIAIPAYKATYLKQAIDSVLAQTFTDWELIIVNDKSPEPISEIVESYADYRIRYYVNETNIGNDDPAVNWNKCLSYARGEFFALLCDDDYYEPSFLEEMLALAAKYPNVSVFRSRTKLIDENNQVLDYYPSAPEWESCLDYLWHKVSIVRRQTISEFLLRRKHIVSLGGYAQLPKAWFADEISIYRFSEENGIASTNLFLARFRNSRLNISGHNNRNIRQKVEACNICVKWIEQFIRYENDEYVRIVLTKNRDRKRIFMTQYLAKASWRNFVSLWIHRKSEQHHIYSRCFIKALVKRMATKLKKD